MKKASFRKVVGLWLLALMVPQAGNAEPPEIMVDTMIMDGRFVIFYLTNLEDKDFECRYIYVKATVKDRSGHLVGRRNIIVQNVTLAAGSLESQMEAGKEMIKRFENQYDQPRIVTISDAKYRCEPKVFRSRLKDGGKGPEMVWIPAGTFRMGYIQGGGRDNEKPVHRVSVSRFAIGKYEVTFAEYDKFAQATGREKPDDKGWGRGNRPVINVSWHDATAYAKWLSEQTGKQYRLPTEAQWEYVARAGTETKYWWGNQIGKNRAACDGCGAEWGLDAKKMTAPVGSFAPNPFGIYDTVGNVWEWCADSWHPSYKGAPNDGQVWRGGDENYRVLRGGSWYFNPWFARTAFRVRDVSVGRFDGFGFRVVSSVAWTR